MKKKKKKVGDKSEEEEEEEDEEEDDEMAVSSYDQLEKVYEKAAVRMKDMKHKSTNTTEYNILPPPPPSGVCSCGGKKVELTPKPSREIQAQKSQPLFVSTALFSLEWKWDYSVNLNIIILSHGFEMRPGFSSTSYDCHNYVLMTIVTCVEKKHVSFRNFVMEFFSHLSLFYR